MSNIAAPRPTDEALRGEIVATVRTLLGAVLLTALLVTLTPFVTVPTGTGQQGNIVNQLGYGLLAAIALLGHLLFTDRRVVLSLLRPVWIVTILWYAVTTAQAVEPEGARRAYAFMVAAMIAADKNGLGDWELVESGEQAMLAQVARNDQANTPTVFLAWAPHPMNIAHEITYLTGGDEEFGPDFGGATVHTLARTEWAQACPNAARLLSNMTFSVDMENGLMGSILDDGMTGTEAATAWLRDNPEVISEWTSGVTTLDGQPGLEAVRAELGL